MPCQVSVEARAFGESKGLVSNLSLRPGANIVTIVCNGKPAMFRFWPGGRVIGLEGLGMYNYDLLRHATVYTMPMVFSPDPPRAYLHPEIRPLRLYPRDSMTIHVNDKIFG